MDHDDLTGPVNLVGPQASTNREFSKILAKVVHRPLLFRVPAFLIGPLGGEMAREMILGSTRVTPAVLVDHGFNFEFSDLEQALQDLLKPGPGP
jgi:NAD dependent epimerase/dehydratase family enzyme